MTATTKITSAVAAGVLGLAVTGAAAFAAFQPGGQPAPAAGAVQSDTAQTGADRAGTAETLVDRTGAAGRIKAVLDKLVQNGTITQAQEDAIVQAFKDAAGKDKDKDGRKVLATAFRDLMKASADYLGLPREQLRQDLAAGQSLGQIADATAGKSRQGLIDTLTTDVNTKVDQLQANGTVSADRAAKIKAAAPARIAKLVDRTFRRKAPKATPTPET